MEVWNSQVVDSAQAFPRSSRADRVLTVTSGNAQNFALDPKEGIENQLQYPKYNHPCQEPRRHLGYGAAPPVSAIPSNDLRSSQNLRFAAKKARHSLSSSSRRRTAFDRSYLQHKKYIEYRQRPRKDAGKDGKDVWSDHVEDAFQEGQLAFRRRICSTDFSQPWSRSSQWDGKNILRMASPMDVTS